jgi:thiol-disulfide isomerase/thioredoxin
MPSLLLGVWLLAAGPAPEVELHLADGTSLALSSYSGKVVLVDFWASWCGPCKKSLPALDQLYREYRDRGLEVIAVNVDEDRKAALQFLEGRSSGMHLAFDPKGVAPRAFGVEGMPSSFLIDRKGAIRHSHMGYTEKTLAAYRDEIEALLRERP